ncbi:MAG: 2-oxo-4-hydroxy-4-carboxy-5-ureidoimidazoline decarboxylase, partial [Nitratireductor sp.]|nr:2-oxo-4-hydroxy-4-carboxy-5-ureidoimidazoline decarboxylase [Nitratireductor sp.]
GALKRFIDYVQSHDRVWTPTRAEIAAHWREHFPWQDSIRPSRMGPEDFVSRYGGVFEHSAWIAERAWAGELAPANDSAIGLHAALTRQFRAASPDERLGVLNAHPDLAGKLAAAKQLTAESTAEQASAGLDMLSDAERATFMELNTAYIAKFGFPFIIAVKGLDKAQILEAFKTRINNDRDTEFATACRQVEKIALLRLKDMLP